MVLKENKYCSTFVLTFLTDLNIHKIKLVSRGATGLLPFLQISDINHSGICTIPKGFKRIAVFPFSTHRNIVVLLVVF